MIEKYISENGIKDMLVENLEDSYKKLQTKFEKETVDVEQKKDWGLWLVNFVAFLGAVFFISWVIYTIDIGTTHFGEIKSPGYAIIVFALLLIVYTFHNMRKKPKIIKTFLSKNKIQLRVEKGILDTVAGGSADLKMLGKAIYEHTNNITGNTKRDYLGEAYIAFPKNPTDVYSFAIVNKEKLYSAVKQFNIGDIVSFKRFEVDADPSKYFVDTSDMEHASNMASSARIERSVANGAGANEGLLRSISNDRKMIAERDARNDLNNKINEMKERKRDETIFLVFVFKDGSVFHINHIKESGLQKLEKILEQ